MELQNLKSVKALKETFPVASFKDASAVLKAVTKWCDYLEKNEINNNVEEIKAKLKASGISLKELEYYIRELKTTKARADVAPKYRFVDVNGVERFWTGRGRTPRELVELMERDHTTKENYLIAKDATDTEENANNDGVNNQEENQAPQC